MNPIKALVISASKMPPAVMLLIIIGLAAVVTAVLTGKVSEQERSYASGQRMQQANKDSAPNAHSKRIAYARTFIPIGSRIESKQIEMRNTDELDVFDDSFTSLDEIVGANPKHSIPAHAQVRKVDLE